MHHGSQCILPSDHRNLWHYIDERFQEFRAWSMRTLFSYSKFFRPVAQNPYPHNSQHSLSLRFYATSGSRRTGRRLCSACADRENGNLVSSPRSSSGPWWRQGLCRFHREYGFFQPEKHEKKWNIYNLTYPWKQWLLHWVLVLILMLFSQFFPRISTVLGSFVLEKANKNYASISTVFLLSVLLSLSLTVNGLMSLNYIFACFTVYLGSF